MLVAVCQLLYKDSPSSMRVLCNADIWVHSKPDEDYSLFAEGCYVFTSCGTPTKISILRYLFKNLNLLPTDLDFELIPIADAAVNETTTVSGNSSDIIDD